MAKAKNVVEEKPKPTLEDAVKSYLSECANPAPDATMRLILRKQMADMVGVEDPAVSLRRWHEGNTKGRPR